MFGRSSIAFDFPPQSQKVGLCCGHCRSHATPRCRCLIPGCEINPQKQACSGTLAAGVPAFVSSSPACSALSGRSPPGPWAPRCSWWGGRCEQVDLDLSLCSPFSSIWLCDFETIPAEKRKVNMCVMSTSVIAKGKLIRPKIAGVLTIW